MKNSITLSLFLFALLTFTSLLTASVSALGDSSPLRPEWLGAGDYVTYLKSETAQGITQIIHMRETVMDNSSIYLNNLRIEDFGEHVPSNYPSNLAHFQPDYTEHTSDGNFITTEEKVAKYNPEIELVRGLNNKTYEAYKLMFHQIYDLGDPCSDCKLIVWYEKETLIKVKQLQWYEENGINVTSQQLIEDSNIQGLAAASSSSTPSSTPAKTVTTTIFVKSPQTIVTTTTTVTVTTTITGSTTAETTTVTETRNTVDSNAAIPISAGIVLAGAVISITLLKKKASPS